MKSLFSLVLALIPTTLLGQAPASHEDQLLHMHSELIRAHVEGRVDLWMSLEAQEYTSLNGGRITFPTMAAREEQRAAYLQGASFEVYRDLREPIVRVSDDGSLGWLMAEVQVSGTLLDQDGNRVPFHDVWAWVEFYEHTGEGWRLTGNASNRR